MGLFDKHGIPKAEKPVTLRNRFFICVQYMFPPRESGNQHHQGAFRQVEIGDQTVHGLEGVAGINKNLRPFGFGFKCAVIIDEGFQRAAGGGADAEDSAAAAPGFIENGGGFLAEHTQLRVHMVVRNLFRLYRAEGPQAHMQRHEGGFHTL